MPTILTLFFFVFFPAPGHDGHHDGFICLSEWRSFFEWCTEHGDGEKYLVLAEKEAAKAGNTAEVIQEKFNARVETLFKQMDRDNSGELSIDEMERVFGEETHEYWEEMDGEAGV